MEITVNITGLDGLVEALKGLTIKQGTAVTNIQQPAAAQMANTDPAAGTVYVPPVQTQPVNQAPPVQQTPPVQMPTQAPVQPAPQQAPPVQQPPAQGVPTSTTSYSFEDLATAATALSDSAGSDGIRALLKRFGVQALTQLQPDQYGAFANELRMMGAKL
ncbi:hypothetical protein Q5O14_17850 [Eubacteriaceae bacterium ES2]|nr:hypothetical protein Q5O14_17850 [Eubacteriaceae bacterium ES2]